MLTAALQREACARFGQFIAGVRSYRLHPARRNLPDMPLFWQQGTTRLLDYAPQLGPAAPQLVVVPSLINRFHVLDLAPGRSFLRWLGTQGIRPLLVDWDEPGETERKFGAGDYVRRLAHMLDWLTEQRTEVHLLGYCLGGTLAVALAQLRPRLVKSLTALAAPWDFHAGDPGISVRAMRLVQGLQPFFARDGLFPVEALQALLTGIQPMLVIDKFTNFPALPPAEQTQFALLEDWLNDGVPLGPVFARDLFEKFYGANEPARKHWQVAGQTVDPAKIATRTLVVAPKRDRIVPQGAAQALATQLPHATLCEPPLGHVGMMVGQQAETLVWHELKNWVLSEG